MDSVTRDLIKQVFKLLSVHSFKELHDAYSVEDQKLFVSREWDPHEDSQIINQVKSLLIEIDQHALDKVDRMWRNETLWLYYHHGISYAFWKSNPKLAQTYAKRALSYQDVEHPNRITMLLYLLAQEKLAEARKWAANIPPHLDRDLAFKLIKDYEYGRLF